ncbi:hypothetical protein WR25_14744 [Diploscapter pachys]|uniref:Gustatory receptor n=1 Tax=Diploscapter pachys TaxID=2018661 RepID=A0A2A2JN19_9BILA|nr:hypothetical protein WR25_14744 [Diploscapter pachys]
MANERIQSIQMSSFGSQQTDSSSVSVQMVRNPPVRVTPKLIFGPFYYFLRFSTFNMSPAVTGPNRTRPIRALAILLAFFINLLMIARFFILLFDNSEKAINFYLFQPFTQIWAKNNLLAFQVLYGFNSAMALISWTKTGFLDSFCERLMRCRQMRLKEHPPPNRAAGRVFLYGILFVLVGIWTTVTVSDAILYWKNVIGSHQQKTFDMVMVYGIDPIVYTFASIASAICILIYVIFNYMIANEFQIFNEELEEEAKQDKLINLDTLSSFNERHFELVQFLQFANLDLQKLASGGLLGIGIANANSVFWAGGFYKEISTINRVIATTWSVILVIMASLNMQPPSQVQTQLTQTRKILRSDKILQGNYEKQVRFHFKEIIARSKHDYCLRCIESIKIVPWLQGVYYLIVPNCGTIMAIIRRVIDNR